MHRYGDIPYTILGVLVLSAAIAVVVRGVIIIPKLLRLLHKGLGVSTYVVLLVLMASLGGSFLDIPVAKISEHASGTVINFLESWKSMAVRDPAETVIAVNVGGAVVPTLASLYLLIKNGSWAPALVGTTGVAAICYLLARPVPGEGIAIWLFAPAAAAAALAWLLSRAALRVARLIDAGPLAYVSGSLGTLIGCDLLNLDKIPGLGVPVVSIGGAGTYDAIFMIGLLAVLLSVGDQA
jgi:uncharacterized membrane protein